MLRMAMEAAAYRPPGDGRDVCLKCQRSRIMNKRTLQAIAFILAAMALVAMKEAAQPPSDPYPISVAHVDLRDEPPAIAFTQYNGRGKRSRPPQALSIVSVALWADGMLLWASPPAVALDPDKPHEIQYYMAQIGETESAAFIEQFVGSQMLKGFVEKASPMSRMHLPYTGLSVCTPQHRSNRYSHDMFHQLLDPTRLYTPDGYIEHGEISDEQLAAMHSEEYWAKRHAWDAVWEKLKTLISDDEDTWQPVEVKTIIRKSVHCR